jgi:hypothetical protein
MRRLLISIVGGVFIPSFMLGFALLMDVGLGLEPITTPFYWIIGWPIYVFARIFPGNNPLYPDEVTRTAFIASLLFDALIFSLLTYVALWWKENRLQRHMASMNAASNNSLNRMPQQRSFHRCLISPY